MAHEETLKNLQKALSMELSAAHQYQLLTHALDDWGIDRLAGKMRQEMQEELGHSDFYIERVLFLKGDPDLRLTTPPARPQSLTDMFEADTAAILLIHVSCETESVAKQPDTMLTTMQGCTDRASAQQMEDRA